MVGRGRDPVARAGRDRAAIQPGAARVRLPSTNAAKAKTWVQMLGIGFVVLSPIVAKRGNLVLLFGIPLAAALVTMLILRFTPRRRFRPSSSRPPC